MKISICIPTWEQHGKGDQFLRELLISIKNQTFTNFNVVISDHSEGDDIRGVIGEFDMDFIYIKNVVKRGNGPANTNNSLIHADGDIIKVMFQDDLFVDTNALQSIHNTFINEGCKWLVSGCNHTSDGKVFNREMIPSWNDRIIKGVNTISSPSVLSIKNNDIPYFDEDLVMLMDCDYYYQLFLKHGEPYILSETQVSNRTHKHQISSMYSGSLVDEIKHTQTKYEIL